jgi:hypothetical protein
MLSFVRKREQVSSYSILCSADLLGPLANFARIT